MLDSDEHEMNENELLLGLLISVAIMLDPFNTDKLAFITGCENIMFVIFTLFKIKVDEYTSAN